VVGLGGSQLVAEMPGSGGASWRVDLGFTQLDPQRRTMAATVHVAPGDRSRGGDEGGEGRGGDEG
jgi:hypothetical protein